METRGNLNNQEATEFDEDLICEAFEFLTFLGDYLEKIEQPGTANAYINYLKFRNYLFAEVSMLKKFIYQPGYYLKINKCSNFEEAKLKIISYIVEKFGVN